MPKPVKPSPVAVPALPPSPDAGIAVVARLGKPWHQGKKTHLSIASLVAVVLTRVLSQYLEPELALMVANLLSDEVLAIVVPLLGGAAMHFRSQAGRVVDTQGKPSDGPGFSS